MSTVSEQIAEIEQAFDGIVADANQAFEDFFTLDTERRTLPKGSQELNDNRRAIEAVIARVEHPIQVNTLEHRIGAAISKANKIRNEFSTKADCVDGELDRSVQQICKWFGEIIRLGKTIHYLQHLESFRESDEA